MAHTEAATIARGRQATTSAANQPAAAAHLLTAARMWCARVAVPPLGSAVLPRRSSRHPAQQVGGRVHCAITLRQPAEDFSRRAQFVLIGAQPVIVAATF